MRTILSLCLTVSVLTMASTANAHDGKDHDHHHDHDHECALNFDVETIDGDKMNLEDYEGKVVLIVNVASKCGYTKQYDGLQAIYEKYKDKGLVVLGFPCNQFGGQEPGTSSDIKDFCTTKFDVSFPMFAKVEVNGDNAAPNYKYMTAKDVGPKGAGDVSWNFEKFLIDREGQLVGRYKSRVAPTDPDLISAIEKLL